MRIQVRSLWLVALLRWQTLAWVTPFATQAKGEQMAHLVVHHSDVDHHHHDGASLHRSTSRPAPTLPPTFAPKRRLYAPNLPHLRRH